MKTTKKILLVIAAILALVVLAGVYKFNYLSGKTGYDVDGNKIEDQDFETLVKYISSDNAELEVLFNTKDDRVTLTLLETEDTRLKMYDAYRVESPSGEQYESRDAENIVFFVEKDTASISKKGSSEPFFVGKQTLVGHTNESADVVALNTGYICSDNYTFNVYYGEYGVENKIIPIPENEMILEQRDGSYTRSFTLNRALSASGELWENNDGLAFWSKGNEAFIMQDDEIIHDDCINQNGKFGEASETLYFDPSDKLWKDDIGVCHTCTPENGFFKDGQIEDQPVAIWMKIKLKLKNDLDENPSVQEVQELFDREYSLDPRWFGTHVELHDDVFTIIYAASKTLEYDFRERNSALNAYYTVTEVDTSYHL